MPTYTIFCGVNGAGKSTLFYKINELNNFGQRINCDEILQNLGKDWMDKSAEFQSGYIAVKKIKECLQNKQSFNQETTVITPLTISRIKQAKQAGYDIELYFVGLQKYKTALKRINKRVRLGGHGIQEKDIYNRFSNQFKNLSQAIKLSNRAYIFDNTQTLQLVSYYKDGEQIIKHSKIKYIDEKINKNK